MEWLIIFYYIITLLSIIIIVVNTDTPSKALSYVFLVIIFPIFGIIFYFSVGYNLRKNKLYAKKLDYNHSAFSELDTKLADYSQSILERISGKLETFLPLARYCNHEYPISQDNQITLLNNGEEKFPEVLKALEQAQHHIHIEYYIFEADAIGNQVLDLLIKKAQQGVQVRFIYDAYGSKKLSKTRLKEVKQAGVEAFPFYKIKWMLFANGINYRNHRKIIIVDAKLGFVGGVNVSDKYINTENSTNEYYWRDTHVKINGPAVLNLQHVFLTDWNFCAKQNIEFSKEYFPVEILQEQEQAPGAITSVVASGPDSDYPSIRYAMQQAILLAKHEVLLTTPYFIPDKSFMDAIKIAVLSDIKIKMLVPGISDSGVINTVSDSYYAELLALGVEIYKYQKGFVHAKTMVCDGLVSFVGTFNLDQRSFDLNFEITSVVFDENFGRGLKEQFENDLTNSKLLNKEEWSKRSRLKIMKERLLRLISPLM